MATALALPTLSAAGDELWWRPAVVLSGLTCVLVTLVAQGLTLTPLVQAFGVGSETDEHVDVLELRRRALQQTLDRLVSLPDADDAAMRTVVTSYRGRLETEDALLAALEKQGSESGAATAEDAEQLSELDLRLREAFHLASDFEREIVLVERLSGRVTPADADEVLRDIEARAARSGP